MPTYEQNMKATAGNAPTKMIDPMTGMPVQTSMVPPAPPAPSNTMGNAQPVFNDAISQTAQNIYGSPEQRQMSLGNRAPLYFKDQNGDGEITRADVIKARIEGYED
jgi:hypothetical protein